MPRQLSADVGQATNTVSSTSSPRLVTETASFIHKPPRGWLHPDDLIMAGGMTYGVRYIGCLEVNTSMKSLDFETRSIIAKESINRVCEVAGLKTTDKRRKVDKRIARMLAASPCMDHAGSNITLTITSAYLNLVILESGELIAKHDMPNISFASGGDADTLDFVAYVAKDHNYGRACFILECGGGLAQDVITTIGQAFELRFKEFLQGAPATSSVTSNSQLRTETKRSKRNDPEYYNDLPGKAPPEIPPPVPPLPVGFPHSKPVSMEKSIENLIDLTSDLMSSIPAVEHNYVNDSILNGRWKDNKPNKDPFDMQPFSQALQMPQNSSTKPTYATATTSQSGTFLPPPPPRNIESSVKDKNGPTSFVKSLLSTSMPQMNKLAKTPLKNEPWFHGTISRIDSESLVKNDGDFLVRESLGSAGQYVLTGMQNGARKHLLLVDPEGVVRTKDRTFESVSHLIHYHSDNGLPIISAESALVLRAPIFKSDAMP